MVSSVVDYERKLREIVWLRTYALRAVEAGTGHVTEEAQSMVHIDNDDVASGSKVAAIVSVSAAESQRISDS